MTRSVQPCAVAAFAVTVLILCSVGIGGVSAQCEEMRCRTCLQVAVNAIYNALPYEEAHRDCCQDVNKILQYCEADDSQTAPQGQADVIDPNYGGPYCTLVGNEGRGYAEAEKAKCVKGVKYIRMCGACKVMPPHKTPCPPMADFLKCQCYAAECLLSSKKYALYLENEVRKNKNPLDVIAEVHHCAKALSASTDMWDQHIKQYYQPAYVDTETYRKKCANLIPFCDICQARERDFALLGPPKEALAPPVTKPVEPNQLYETAPSLLQVAEQATSRFEYESYYQEERKKDLRLGAGILMQLKEGIMSAAKACDPNFCRHVHVGDQFSGSSKAGGEAAAAAVQADMSEQTGGHIGHKYSGEQASKEHQGVSGDGGDGDDDDDDDDDDSNDSDPNALGNDESVKEIEAAEKAIGSALGDDN